MATVKEIQDALIRSIKAVERENAAARAASRIALGPSEVDVDLTIEPEIEINSRR